jgi:hypothetical protein
MSATAPRIGLFAATGVVAALVLASIAKHPDMLAEGPDVTVYLVALGLGLAVSLGAALWGTRTRNPVARGAMLDGCRWGLLFGALWIVEMVIANLAYAVGSWTIVPYRLSIWAVWALTVVAGALGARRYRRVWAGVLIGMWSGLVSGLIGLATMQIIALTAMPVLLRDPQNISEFAGSADLPTAIAADFVGAGISHLVLVGLIIGTILATIGALIGRATVRSGATT